MNKADAHNVKIIVQDGKVPCGQTLNGSRSRQELVETNTNTENMNLFKPSVFGIFRTRKETAEAVDALRAAGFRNTDISALLPENQGTEDLAHEKNTKGPKETAAVAASGVLLGGALGLLAGIGALAIPGVGPFIGAGPIMAALSGAHAGAVTGGVLGGLTGLGMPEPEAKRYEGRIGSEGILLSVHCDDSDWVKRAKEILESAGASDIALTGEASADFAKTEKSVLQASFL